MFESVVTQPLGVRSDLKAEAIMALCAMSGGDEGEVGDVFAVVVEPGRTRTMSLQSVAGRVDQLIGAAVGQGRRGPDPECVVGAAFGDLGLRW